MLLIYSESLHNLQKFTFSDLQKSTCSNVLDNKTQFDHMVFLQKVLYM